MSSITSDNADSGQSSSSDANPATSSQKFPPRLTMKEKLGRGKNKAFEALKKEYVDAGKLYEDPDFPANESSIYYSPDRKPWYMTWKRPHEILTDPKFVVGKNVRFDVDQHALGDCWYLAALSTVASRPALLRNVVPTGQSFDRDYAGMFQFIFWRFGQWEHVIIDDRLPYDTRTKRLCFCYNRNEPAEFWSALCEKAYAKLHGSYEALEGGHPQDALVDLTGAIGEDIPLKEQLKDSHLREAVWKRMMTSNDAEHGPLLNAGIFQPRGSTTTEEGNLGNGLFTGHAYSITAVKEVSLRGGEVADDDEENARLVRVRNPWGGVEEWTGKWSDGSSAWRLISKERRESLDLKNDDDGEFWLSYKDFVANFDALMLGNLTSDTYVPFSFHIPPILKTREGFGWNEKCLSGSWVRGVNAGGRERIDMNPQFQIKLKDSTGQNDLTPLVVSLMQKDRRAMRTPNNQNPNLGISFSLYQPRTEEVRKFYRMDQLRSIDRNNYTMDREFGKTYSLPPGIYVVIPSTWHADKEGDFLVRFMTMGPIDAVPGDEVPSVPFVPGEKSEVEMREELFFKYCGDDRVIDSFELGHILTALLVGIMEATKEVSFGQNDLVCILESFDNSGSKRLDRSELKECWETIKNYHLIFKQLDVNEDGFFGSAELKKAFAELKIRLSHRVLAVLIKKYATKIGLLNFKAFLIAVSTIRSLSKKWRKTQFILSGQISFEEYLLWEINEEIPIPIQTDNNNNDDEDDGICVIL